MNRVIENNRVNKKDNRTDQKQSSHLDHAANVLQGPKVPKGPKGPKGPRVPKTIERINENNRADQQRQTGEYAITIEELAIGLNAT